MSDHIRFELTGKHADQWNRIFGLLSDVIMRGITAIAPPENNEDKKVTEQYVSDIAELSKSWMAAKAERPGLENEKLAAEIVSLFEDAKLKRTKCEEQQLINESAHLDLMVKRVETAIKLMGLLQTNFVYEDGKLTLLLTNQSLAVLHSDLKALSPSDSVEVV